MAVRAVLRPIFAAGLALAILAPAAVARAITFEFAGVVTELGRDGGLFGAPGSVNVGDGFTGRFSYELGAGNPDQNPGDSEVGAYVLASLEVDQSVVPLALSGVGILHRAGGATLPPAPPDPGRDWLVASATTGSYASSVSVRLLGPFGSAFADDSLPTALDLTDFPDGGFLVGLQAVGISPAPSIEDLGMLTSLSVAPEPLVLVWLGCGAGALALRRRRVTDL